MVRRMIILIALIVTTCGFASTSELMRQQLKTLPQHYSNFDVNMAWDVKTIDGTTFIDGVIQNIRYSTMEDIEVRVALLDANGKTLRRSVDFVIPRQMDMNDTGTFSVKLKSAATHGAKLVFTYKYSGFEGHSGGGGVNWTQSFESKIP